jgi:exopolysaccharide biosynthesis polyprenyl glycosylphosphotransferase
MALLAGKGGPYNQYNDRMSPGGRMNRVGSRGTWRWLLPPIGDFCLFYAGLALALLLRQPALISLDTAVAFAPLFAGWLIVLYTLGLYELRLTKDFVSLIRNLIASAVICMAVGVTYFYALGRHTDLTPKTILIIALAVSHVQIFVWRRAWLWLLNFDLLDQRFVFLGEEADLRAIERDMPHHEHETGLTIVPWQWPGVDMVVADERWVDAHWDQAREVFLAAVERGVPIVSLDDFYEAIFGKVAPAYAGHPSWALKHILSKSTGFYWKVKRATDLIGSMLLLILSAPLLLITAAVVAIMDGRPVFFAQPRAGYLGKPFMLWKFRTMEIGAETKGPFTSARAHDSRITRLGAVLRRFRLDELPQLWNVLRGDMSLVGPRPEWMREVEVLEKVVPSYHLRHLVYPGITGWAQVRFRATNSIDDSIEKIHYDLFYVKFLSLSLDFGILLKTIKRVLVNDASVNVLPSPALKPKQTIGEWANELNTTHERTYSPQDATATVS